MLSVCQSRENPAFRAEKRRKKMQQIQTAGLLYVLKAQLLVVPGANLPATRQRTFIKTQKAAVFVEQKGEKKKTPI